MSSNAVPHNAVNMTRSSNFLNEVFPTTSYAPATASAVYRRLCRQSVAALSYIYGFESANLEVLDQLTHIMSSYMSAICESTKLNCEVAGRTITIPSDVWLALVNMGCDVTQLPDYRERTCNGTLAIHPPKVQANAPHNNALRVGRARPHPQHVNDFLPLFPDPHTYIRTEICGEPDTSYEKVREMAAQRKRNSENSLVSLMLRMHPRTCLFSEFEGRVTEEARKAIEDRERQKEARRLHRKAKAAEKVSSAMELDGDMPDNLFDEDDMMDEDSKDTQMSESEEEIDLELPETETSLVLRRIPNNCYILDPSLETRPYLSALASDDVQDDETPDNKQNNQNQGENSENAADEPAYDNPFLRPPRIKQEVDME